MNEYKHGRAFVVLLAARIATMPQIRLDAVTFDHRALEHFCGRVLQGAGLGETDSRLVANTLIEANLRGIDSHGVARLPHYLRRIQQGSINPQPTIRVQRLGPSCGRVDGDNGLGQVVMQRAAQESITLARETGAGWVAVARSSHCGALAYYGLQIADAGMIGFVFSHVDSMVLPHGARKPFCGTNPICLTAPRTSSGGKDSQGGALCLDMATSKVSWNAIANAAMEGIAIEQGWAVDAAGRETTDPMQVSSLYPFGDYKGSGLGLMIDVFCAMLSDAPIGPDIPPMYGDLAEPRLLGGLVGAIDIERFVPLTRFHARIDDLIRRWASLPPREPDGQVLYPGEPELIRREQRVREGIPLGPNVLRELEACARRYDLELGLDKLRPQVPGPPGRGAPTRGPSPSGVSQAVDQTWDTPRR